MKLFSRNKETSDPALIIQNSLSAVVNRISDSLDEDEYHWMKPWGVKRFESMVLAKTTQHPHCLRSESVRCTCSLASLE